MERDVPVVIHGSTAAFTAVAPRQETTAVVAEAKAPNPILPTAKEMAWGFGSFIVLFLLMRYWLFPKVRKGMEARSARIRADLDGAESVREAAATDEVRYEAAIA